MLPNTISGLYHHPCVFALENLEQINEAGRRAASFYPGTIFWEQNWRKGGLQDRRNQLLKEYDFYNQLYCGCEFSMKRLEQQKENKAE